MSLKTEVQQIWWWNCKSNLVHEFRPTNWFRNSDQKIVSVSVNWRKRFQENMTIRSLKNMKINFRNEVSVTEWKPHVPPIKVANHDPTSTSFEIYNLWRRIHLPGQSYRFSRRFSSPHRVQFLGRANKAITKNFWSSFEDEWFTIVQVIGFV